MNSTLTASSKTLLSLCLTIILLDKPCLLAQPIIDWDHTYGGSIWEELNSVVPTKDGGFLLGGFTSSGISAEVSQSNFGGGDFWVMKTDAEGEKLWDRRYGGDSLDRIWKVLPLDDGGYLLAGETWSNISGCKTAPKYGGRDFWIVRVTGDGDPLWDKSFGGTGDDWLLSVAPAKNGGFLLGGWSDSPPNPAGHKSAPHKGKEDMWVLMLDSDGNVQWDRTYGGSDQEQLHYITAANDGNFFICGASASDVCADKSQPSRGSVDFWYLKINPAGDILWEKTFGGAGEDVAITMKEAFDGTLFIGGGSASGISGDKTTDNLGGADYWLLKTDASGNVLYQKRFGGGNLDKLYAIDLTRNGYALLGGISGSGQNLPGNKSETSHGDWDMWILYLDPAGEYVWDKVIGGTGQDALTDLTRVRDGSFLLVGNSASDASFEKSENSRGMNDFWLVKTYCDSPVKIHGDSIACQYEEVELDAEVENCSYCQYTWMDDSHGPAIHFIPAGDTSAVVFVVDNTGCEFRDSFPITVFENPQVAEFDLIPALCYGDKTGSISLMGVSGGTPPYQYSFEGGDYSEVTEWPLLEGGNFPVAVKDWNGCHLDTLVGLPFPVKFEINLGNDTIIFLGDSITLQPHPTHPIDSYQWTDPSMTTLYPTVKPSKITTYEISAVNGNGCPATDRQTVYIRLDQSFFAPNVFSPDGNGINDIFTVFAGQHVTAIHDLRIFDRWGNEVFYRDIIFPGETQTGWDGNFRGKPAAEDVYVYHVQLEFIDGSREVAKGDFTLLR